MRSWPAVGALVVLAAVFAIVAALYWLGALQLFTSTGAGPHPKHALVFGGLALLSLIAANFVRPRPDLAS